MATVKQAGGGAAEKEAKSLYQTTVDKVVHVVERAWGFGKDSWRSATTRVRSDARAFQAAVRTGSLQALELLKGLAVVSLAVLFVLCVFVAVLFVCLWLAGVSAVVVRYYTLSRVAGNHVVPLPFNTMPLHTEWWRNRPIDDAITRFVPSLEYAGARRSSLPGPDADGNGGGRREGGEGEGGNAFPFYGVAAEDGASGIGASPGNDDDLLSRIRQAGLRLTGQGAAVDGGGGVGGLVQAQAGKLLDFKLAFLQQYANSLLATSTMIISTGAAKTLFLPGGAVNMEAIFDFGSPMFSAQGVYSGRMQLVFVREEVGRDVSVIVESAMLFAEDARSPQSLSSLDVLFRRTHTVHVRTGDPPLSWVARFVAWWLRIVFYLPLKAYEVSQRWIRDSRSAPFPPIDHDREVAVLVDVYERFTPPPSLRSRLRALNFTVYYNHLNEGSALSRAGARGRPALSRITFYSHVRLRGFTYFMAAYPVVSFLFLTAVLLVVYAAVALTTVTVGGAVLYYRFFSGAESDDERDRDGSDDKFKWTFPQNASFSSNGASPTTPMMPSFALTSTRHSRDGGSGLGRPSSARSHDHDRSHHTPDALHSARLTGRSSSSLVHRSTSSTSRVPSQFPPTQSKKTH